MGGSWCYQLESHEISRRATDPRALHALHLLGPQRQGVQALQQLMLGLGWSLEYSKTTWNLLCVARDAKVPLVQLSLLDQSSAAPRSALIVHLFIGKHMFRLLQKNTAGISGVRTVRSTGSQLTQPGACVTRPCLCSSRNTSCVHLHRCLTHSPTAVQLSTPVVLRLARAELSAPVEIETKANHLPLHVLYVAGGSK